jgi:hypothetical protein
MDRDMLRRLLAVVALILAVVGYLLGASPSNLATAVAVGLVAAAWLL